MSKLESVPAPVQQAPASRLRQILGYCMYLGCFWLMTLLTILMAPSSLAESVGRSWIIPVVIATLPLSHGLRFPWYVKVPLAGISMVLLLVDAQVTYGFMHFKSDHSVANSWLLAGACVCALYAVIARWLAVYLVSPTFRVFSDDAA